MPTLLSSLTTSALSSPPPILLTLLARRRGFLWLPSLEGPVSDYTKGSGWLFGDAAQGYAWTDFTPPLGWADTGAYLALPVLLVMSQYISTAILTPKSDDPAQQQTQAILKFLPLMIGWFSLSVPSGLGLYWITNNVVTTLTTVLIKKSVATPAIAGMDGGVSAAAEPVKSQGFGRQYGEVVTKQSEDGTTVKISPPGTRKERKAAAAADGPVVDAVVVDAAMGAAATGGPAAAANVVDAQFTELDTGGGVGDAAGGKKKKKKKSKKSKK